MKKLALAFVLTGTLMLSLGSFMMVSAASPGNGATVINIDTCVPLIGGGTVCVESTGMVHEVTAASGNISFTTNYREHMQVFDAMGQTTWDETSNERFHALTMDGLLQEMSSRSRFTITTVGEPFCVDYHIHGTRGVDQFVRVDFCS